MAHYVEIEYLLLENLYRAREANNLAEERGTVNLHAMFAWINALREFSDFILNGTVPDRFKESTAAPNSASRAPKGRAAAC
jgi:hypothetical protein